MVYKQVLVCPEDQKDCSHWACSLGLRVLRAALLLCGPEPWQPAAWNLSRGVLGRLGVLLGAEAEWGVGQCHLDSAGSSPEPGECHGWPGSLRAPAGASERGAQGSLMGVKSLMSPSPAACNLLELQKTCSAHVYVGTQFA